MVELHVDVCSRIEELKGKFPSMSYRVPPGTKKLMIIGQDECDIAVPWTLTKVL
jgi:hypothetical protein